MKKTVDSLPETIAKAVKDGMTTEMSAIKKQVDDLPAFVEDKISAKLSGEGGDDDEKDGTMLERIAGIKK